MKKILLIATLLVSIAGFGQSEKFKAGMHKNLELMDSAKTQQDYEAVASGFERIAEAEKTEWLPYYYAALAQLQKAFTAAKPTDNDAIADRAEALIAKGQALSKDNAELLCLMSMSMSARMMVDVQARGAQYGPKGGAYLQQAIQLDPKNPRAFVLLGQSTLFTPAFWGGGKEKAKPLLQKAVDNFKEFKPASDLHPKWGKEMAEKLLAQASS